MIAVIWLGDGLLRILALVLGPVMLVLSWYLGAGEPRHSALQQVVEQASGEQIDISRSLSAGAASADEQAYARMTERLRDMILGFQQQSLIISVSSAKSRLLAERANREAGNQQGLSELIFQASDQTTTALQDITGRASTITDMNSRNLDVAQASGQQLGEARSQVQSINDAMASFQSNITRLDSTSSQVQTILKTVQDFSEQTNMLALNAAIEAARAGEQGRGFAVVADEVRNLSVRVGDAASQINGLIGQMIEAMSGAGKQAEIVMS